SGLKIAVRLYKAMVPLTATPLGFRTTRQLSSDGADIFWLKVTATGWLTATPIALSAGFVAVTVGTIAPGASFCDLLTTAHADMNATRIIAMNHTLRGSCFIIWISLQFRGYNLRCACLGCASLHRLFDFALIEIGIKSNFQSIPPSVQKLLL